MAEVGVARARREHEGVVVQRVAVQDEAAGREVHRLHLGQEHGDVRGAAQDGPQRRRDVGGIEGRGGHLVEQGLEEMMVAPIEQGDPDRPPRERAGRVEPPESAAHDDHVGAPITVAHRPIFRAARGGVNRARAAAA